MSITNFIKSICNKLGNNNKAIYPVIAIATANGICRPTFTMLKKGENPESKKYAALREGITEVIAVPTYWACGVLAGKCGAKIVDKAMDKNFAYQERLGHFFSQEAKMEMKTAAIKKGQAGLMLLGVCFAAGVVIPALCSAFVTPIMDRIHKNTKPDIKSKTAVPMALVKRQPNNNHVQFVKRPAIVNTVSYGMKVGGV